MLTATEASVEIGSGLPWPLRASNGLLRTRLRLRLRKGPSYLAPSTLSIGNCPHNDAPNLDLAAAAKFPLHHSGLGRRVVSKWTFWNPKPRPEIIDFNMESTFALGGRGVECLRPDGLLRSDDRDRRSAGLGQLRRPSAGQATAKPCQAIAATTSYRGAQLRDYGPVLS